MLISTKLDDRLVKCDISKVKPEDMDERCKLNLALIKKAEEEKRSLVQNGGAVKDCQECHSHDFVYDSPEYTVGVIEQIIDRILE